MSWTAYYDRVWASHAQKEGSGASLSSKNKGGVDGVGGQKNGDKKRRKGECCIDNLLPFLNDVVESSIWACWEGKKMKKERVWLIPPLM